MASEKPRQSWFGRHKSLIIKITVIVAIAGIATPTLLYLFPPSKEHTPPEYQKITLNRFPVSLDDLFHTDNLTLQQEIVDGIKNGNRGAYSPFIDPYPNYFHGYHSPATMKWYLYARMYTPISFPIDTYLEITDWHPITTEMINGSEVGINVAAYLHVSYYERFFLGHVDLNVSLNNDFNANKVTLFGRDTGRIAQGILIPKDTIVGFTDNLTALDFVVEDDTIFNLGETIAGGPLSHSVNPYLYFTDTARNQIDSYYSIQYNAEKEAGIYPDAELNRTSYDINENHSYFGSWFYMDGYFTLNSSHLNYNYHLGFDGCILDILNVNKTCKDTFYTDVNTGLPFGSDMLGVYYDAEYVAVDGYDRLGGCYMYYQEGDNSSGIIRLTAFFGNERTLPQYMKYQFTEGSSTTLYDDLLTVEYFSTLGAAQGSFDSFQIVYSRLPIGPP